MQTKVCGYKSKIKKKIIREKLHRLPAKMYVGNKTIAFTICIKNNRNLFESTKMFEYFEKELILSLEKNNCTAHVYLFMPDHLHLIVEGYSEDSNIKKAIELFKQKTGYWLTKNMSDYKWQKDYYDHIIRDDEDMRNQIKYILYNPVRASLVENWKDYKFKGSTIYNFEEWE